MIFFELMNDLCESKTLVDIRRDERRTDDIRGFILATSTKLVLVGVVDDGIEHNGFSIIDQEDISFLRWGTDNLLGWEKALRNRSNEFTLSETDLTTWSGAIEVARSKAPLVSFFRERIDDSVCFISDQFRYNDTSIIGRQISTDGQRNGSFALRADDLTRIDFGGRYESGLHRMLQSW